MNTILKCSECERRFDNTRSLSKHLTQTHKISFSDYMMNLYNIEKTKECIVCGKLFEIEWKNRNKDTCCASCRQKHFRKVRKENFPEDEIEFRNKVSESVKRDWEENDQSVRIANMTASIIELMKTYSQEMRKEKFGWQNKLSQEEKDKFHRINLPKSIHNEASQKKAAKGRIESQIWWDSIMKRKPKTTVYHLYGYKHLAIDNSTLEVLYIDTLTDKSVSSLERFFDFV